MKYTIEIPKGTFTFCEQREIVDALGNSTVYGTFDADYNYANDTFTFVDGGLCYYVEAYAVIVKSAQFS